MWTYHLSLGKEVWWYKPRRKTHSHYSRMRYALTSSHEAWKHRYYFEDGQLYCSRPTERDATWIRVALVRHWMSLEELSTTIFSEISGVAHGLRNAGRNTASWFVRCLMSIAKCWALRRFVRSLFNEDIRSAQNMWRSWCVKWDYPASGQLPNRII